MIETTSRFNILKNTSGYLMIVLQADYKNIQTKNPVLEYDNSNTAHLIIDEKYSINLEGIHPAVRDTLYNSESVLVVETMDSEIINEFTAPVIKKENYNG